MCVGATPPSRMFDAGLAGFSVTFSPVVRSGQDPPSDGGGIGLPGPTLRWRKCQVSRPLRDTCEPSLVRNRKAVTGAVNPLEEV